MADISIPEGDNPVRYQASLGGNQKYRNMGNISGQAYLVRGQVTNVYYQKGTLDFNTYGSSVTSGVTDGSGSAPIPVDFWGKNTDGKVFGCYRPVQKGSQILVAYIGGDTSRPIVVGVYPDNESSYELISPVHYNTGDDSTDDVQNDALGERKIYPNQQMMYESGKGDILRSMGGKSFLYISENGSGYLDDINYAYDEISDFYDADANEIEPTMTKAQSWLLVHEDNDSDEDADGHRTRFYVNRSGELMVTFANKDDPNDIVVLEASKDSGFKLTKRFDNSNLKEDSEEYVQFCIGNGNNVSIQSVDSGDATSFYLDNGNIKFNTPNEGSITFDGTSVNDLLGKISDVETAANNAGNKADIAASAGEIAQSAASDAASQALAASYAGEDAKSAAVNAQAAGEDAKAQAQDTRDRIIYYASISNEKDVAVPGKYIIINTDTYIANGTIKTAHIGDAAITNAKIADLAVGTAQLEDAAITRAKIGNLAVGTAQIEDAAITDAKVGDLSANHLKAGTIDFSVISGIHINASEIDVGKIVADQIFVNGLGDISKNLGTVTSGSITGTNVNDDINTVQSGVNDLNNPSLMSVIEKQSAAKQYAGLTSQYNVILERAKDDNISTTDLTTAYTNLDNFMSGLLADTTKASTVDRLTYNSLTYAYNMALSKVQTALSDSYNADIDNMKSSVLGASQAASSAAIVASQAAITGDNAGQVASQAFVVAGQAQSASNNAISAASGASQAADNAILAGSTATVNADKAVSVANQAQSAGNNAVSVANNASQAASSAILAGSTATVNANKAISVANQAQSAGNNATSVANNASQAASNAILAGSTATVTANKASTAASQAQIAGNNATSVANNAVSVANNASQAASSATSSAILVGSQANSAIAVQSQATATAQSTADNAFSQAQLVGSQANSAIAVQSQATATAQSTADNAFSQAQIVGSQASSEIAVQSTATAKAQSAADNAFSQAQLVGSQANSAIAVQSQATATAQSTADNAFSQAQLVGSQASAEISSNSTATAKAQSAADNAFSQATTAIDNGNATSQAVTALKDGSKLTIAELENGLATKVANSDYASYQTQTASQIAQKVDNGAFSAYQTQTADLIASKVANSAFSAYQTQTANAISSKVDTGDFNTYKTQTADLIDDKVSNSEYASDKTQTASQISQMVSNSAFSAYQTQTASQIAQTVSNSAFSAYQTQTADLIASKVANSDFSAYQATTAKSISSKVDNGDFNTYKTQTADLIDDKVSNSEYASDKTQTASQISQMVSNSAFSAYQTQTASQIAQTVSNSAFSAYQTQTASQIAQTVSNSSFSAYQTQTANAINSKVDNGDFNTYKTQTADLIDDKVSSSEYASDKTQTASQISQMVSNSAFSAYQTQTASQIAQTVSNSAFSAYQQTTADLIASKVATKDFSAYQATTAKSIESKVESSDFNTYKTQTADLIDDKVSSSEYASDKTQTASEIADRVSNSAFSTYQTQTASQIASKVDNGAFSAYQTQTADLIAQKVATSDFSAYQATTAKEISSKVESSDFNTYKTQTADAISSKVESSNFQALQTQVQNSAVGTNLIIQSGLQYGYIDRSTGGVTGGSGDFHSDNYIATNGATVFTFSSPDYVFKGAGNHTLAMYDSDKNYLGYQLITSATQTLSKSNVAYIRFSINFTDEGGTSGNLSDWLKNHRYKLEKGSKATDWCLSPEDQATQSDITQSVNNIHLGFKNPDGSTFQMNLSANGVALLDFSKIMLNGSTNITNGTIGTAQIADATITNAKIANLAVGTAQIANGAITNAQIGSLAVDTTNIKDAAISSAKIANLAVGTAQIGDGAITNAKIANLAVGTAQIANGAITTAQIGSAAVGTAQIANAAVGTAQIAALAVGTAQIGDGAITNAKIGKLAVGTAQIANGAITTAQIGSAAVGTAQIANAAVGTAQIANLAVGTAQIGNAAITSAKIANLAVGTAQIANAAITDAQVGNVSANKLTAGTIDFNTITGKNINASNITTGTLNTNLLNVGQLSALSADLGNVTAGSLKGVDIVADTFSTPNGSFTTDASGAVVASNLTIRGVTNLVYNAALLGGNGSNIPGWTISNNGCYWPGNVHDGVPSIGWHNTATGWNLFAQSKLVPLNGTTGIPFSASVWFSDFGSDTSLQYQFTLAFFDSNGNRISSGIAGQTWNGVSSGQGWRYITINNAVAPSTAVSVGLQYWSYNGKGNAEFSSPMLTQTAQATGYQPDTGNVVNAGIINGSTINAGSMINNSNNTSNWYPLTLNPNGDITSTHIDDNAGLQTYISGGAVETRYNEFTANGYGKYTSHIVGMGADGSIMVTDAGTDNKDTAFNAPLTSTYGAVYINASGITLYGANENFLFNGTDPNGTNGIRMDSYGNVHGEGTSAWWRVYDSAGSQVANFGTAPGNNITFPKPIFVDEIGAYSGSNGHALFIHGDDSTSNKTGQMLFRNDGSPQVVSATIYNRTYSSGSTVTVTSYGTLGRITSASKYKLDITKETSLEPANKLLSIDRSSWVDKESAERLANSKTNGTELSEPEINVFRHYGLIAEDLIKAGLDEFVIKGDNGQAEGIEYDRLWTVLIPKIRDLSNQQINDRMTISRLEKEIENLKQEALSK